MSFEMFLLCVVGFIAAIGVGTMLLMGFFFMIISLLERCSKPVRKVLTRTITITFVGMWAVWILFMIWSSNFQDGPVDKKSIPNHHKAHR